MNKRRRYKAKAKRAARKRLQDALSVAGAWLLRIDEIADLDN